MLRSTATASSMRAASRRGNVGALGDVRADGEERRVEAARLHRVEDVVDLAC